MYGIFILLFLSILSATELNAMEDFERLSERQKKEIWHDVKSSSFYKLEPSTNLYNSIASYHSIEKTNREKAPERIEALNQISHLAKELSRKEHFAALSLIERTATNKSTYLTALLGLKKKAMERSFRVIETFGEKSLGLGVKRQFEESEWGLHMDPAMRESLHVSLEEWKDLLPSQSTLPDFYFWLEGQDERVFSLDRLYAEDSATTVEEFFQNKLVVFDERGKAYTVTHGDHSCKPIKVDEKNYYPISKRSRYPYNIDRYGAMYLGMNGTHSYILKGEILLCAGNVSFNEEVFIIDIDTDSGHYKPFPFNLRRALFAMQKHYQKPLFSHLESYGIVRNMGRPQKFLFDRIESIGRESREGENLFFGELYEKLKYIPEDVLDKILIEHMRRQSDLSTVLVKETLKELFSEILKDLSELGIEVPELEKEYQKTSRNSSKLTGLEYEVNLGRLERLCTFINFLNSSRVWIKKPVVSNEFSIHENVFYYAPEGISIYGYLETSRHHDYEMHKENARAIERRIRTTKAIKKWKEYKHSSSQL